MLSWTTILWSCHWTACSGKRNTFLQTFLRNVCSRTLYVLWYCIHHQTISLVVLLFYSFYGQRRSRLISRKIKRVPFQQETGTIFMYDWSGVFPRINCQSRFYGPATRRNGRRGKAEVLHYLYALAAHNPTVDPKIKFSFKHFLVGCDCVYKAGHVNGEWFF